MAGFATINALISALSQNGYGQRLGFAKSMPSTCVANVPHTLWTSTGLPAAGTYGAVGKANGRVLTKASTGAMGYNNPGAGRTMHITSLGGMINAAAPGTLILVDRIADCLIAHNESTGSFTGLTAVSRLAAGEGALIWIEVETAFSAASNTLNFTYTNDQGTAGRTSQNLVTVASSVVGRWPAAAGPYLGLQAGDAGVRSIESVTLVSGTATGQMAICLVRELARIPLPAASVMVERDFVMEIPSLPRVFDDSCLQALIVLNTGATASFSGAVSIAQG